MLDLNDSIPPELVALGWIIGAIVTYAFIHPIARTLVMKALCLGISLLIGPFGLLVVLALRVVGAMKNAPPSKKRRRR